MMSVYKKRADFTKTVVFNGTDPVPQPDDELLGRITFTKTADAAPARVTYENTDYGRVTKLVYDNMPLADSYFAIYRKTEPGNLDAGLTQIGKIVYASDANGVVDIDNFKLPETEPAGSPEEGQEPVWLCEIQPSEGYGMFNTSVALDMPNGYSCIKVRMDHTTAVNNKVTRNNISNYTKDSTKTFSVKVNKTTDGTTPDVGVVFGLYNTEEIQLQAGSVAANTLMAYAVTQADGTAVLSENLPADQNYILREIANPNGNSIVEFSDANGVAYDENDKPATEYVVPVNGQEDMTVEYSVNAKNTYYGKLTVHKIDGDTNDDLPNITFVLQNQEYSFTGTTNNNGVLEIDNIPYGEYTLFEMDAPEEYQSNTTHTITINGSNPNVLYEVKNYKVPVKTIDIIKRVEGPVSEDKTFYFKIEMHKIGTTDELLDTYTETVDGAGELHFTKGFPEAGTYQFVIYEDQDLTDYPGYTNDERYYYYTVDVASTGTGADAHLSVESETLEVAENSTAAKEATDKIEFTNRFELAPMNLRINLEKAIIAPVGQYTGNERFTVNIVATKDGAPIGTDTRQISKDASSSYMATINEPGTYVYTFTESVNNPTEFKPNLNTYQLTFVVIRDGDELKLQAEPAEINGTTIVKDGTDYKIIIENEWEYPYDFAGVKINLKKIISGINPSMVSDDTDFAFKLYENGVEKQTFHLTGKAYDLNGEGYLEITTNSFTAPLDYIRLTVEEQPQTGTNWTYSTDSWDIDIRITEADQPYKHLVASGEIYKNDILQQTVDAPICVYDPDATENNYCENWTDFNIEFRNQYKIPDSEYEVDEINVKKVTTVPTVTGEDFSFIIERAKKVNGE